MIPAIEEDGYDRAFSVVMTSSASVIRPIIHPSIPVLILAVIGSVTVGGLFLPAWLQESL
jgi:TRAP-type C4-dicarboxylate transport system permease large subunit